MDQFYQIAGHLFKVTGEDVRVMNQIPGFDTFAVNKPADAASAVPVFTVCLRTGSYPLLAEPLRTPSIIKEAGADRGDAFSVFSPGADKNIYVFGFEDAECVFSRTSAGDYRFSMRDTQGDSLEFHASPRCGECVITGVRSPRLLYFALWMAYNVLTAATRTVAVHSSVVTYRNKAVLFLGESGTGKSTHTRLWQEHIPGAALLNDDSPVLRIVNEIPYIYGSPWSGKTFCFRPHCMELAAAVRLSQAPQNSMRQLSALEAFGALYPSCPPALVRDEELADRICAALSAVIARVPVYHLACLPDAEAARLSFQTIFGTENKEE